MDKRSLTRLAIAGMMVGGFALTACEDSTSSKADAKTGISAATTLAAFQAECQKNSDTFKSHDCKAMNECKGHSYQEGKGVAQHECKGQSACQGGSCIEG
ncbi:MAG: hypothetical protein M3Y08_17580 [Fibrobacterota bacterium]|nr:hypothetical protein [Fibrobacterota bacterium]